MACPHKSRARATKDGELTLAGWLADGYEFNGSHPLIVPLIALIVYDPEPRTLTQGQLLQTSCYSP